MTLLKPILTTAAAIFSLTLLSQNIYLKNTSPVIKIKPDKANIKPNTFNGKTTYKCWDKFSVEKIAYDENTGRITGLAIRNDTKECRAFVWTA